MIGWRMGIWPLCGTTIALATSTCDFFNTLLYSDPFFWSLLEFLASIQLADQLPWQNEHLETTQNHF